MWNDPNFIQNNIDDSKNHSWLDTWWIHTDKRLGKQKGKIFTKCVTKPSKNIKDMEELHNEGFETCTK